MFKPEVQGHRGQRGLLPENSLPAFISAMEGGAQAIELDLHLTLDKHVIVYHDYTINSRVCTHDDGSDVAVPLLLSGLTLEEIWQYDIGQKQSLKHPNQARMPGLRIPTLKQLFDAILAHPDGHSLQFNLEIKRDTESVDCRTPPSCELAQRVVEEVAACTLNNRVRYSSFDFDILRCVRKLDVNAVIGVLQDETLVGLAEKVLEISAQIVSPKWDLLKTVQDVDLLRRCVKTTTETTTVAPVSPPAPCSYTSVTSTGTRSSSSTTASATAGTGQCGGAGGMCKVVVYTANEFAEWELLLGLSVDGIITDYPSALVSWLKTYEQQQQSAVPVAAVVLEEPAPLVVVV